MYKKFLLVGFMPKEKEIKENEDFGCEVEVNVVTFTVYL